MTDPAGLAQSASSVTSTDSASGGADELISIEVSDAEQHEFDQALEGELIGDDVDTTPAKNVSSIGDAILDGISTAKRDMNSHMDKVDTAIGNEDLNIQEVMSIQHDLAKMAIYGELFAKVPTQLTHHVDTMLKSN